MSAYHSTELCFLSATYIELMIKRRPLDLYFSPVPGGFKDRVLRVAPDMLPPGTVRLTNCWIDGSQYQNFDAEKLHVHLPESENRLKVKVTLTPIQREN